MLDTAFGLHPIRAVLAMFSAQRQNAPRSVRHQSGDWNGELDWRHQGLASPAFSASGLGLAIQRGTSRDCPIRVAGWEGAREGLSSFLTQFCRSFSVPVTKASRWLGEISKESGLR